MQRRLVNIFGAIGYLFLLVQWMWALLIVAVPLVMQPGFQEIFMPQTHSPSEQPTTVREPLPGPVQAIIVGAAILFSISVIVYAIVSVPRAVGRTGQRLTRTAAAKSIPVVTHHKKISKKHERRLIERITWSIKAVLVGIPAILLVVPPSAIINLDHNVSVAFGLLLAAVAIVSFGLQLLLAKIWRIDSRLVW